MSITSESSIIEAIHSLLSRTEAHGVHAAGQGDYCQAYHTDDEWTFLLARHPHATVCLERVARVTPSLATQVQLPIPTVEHSTTVDGRTLVAYRTVFGTPLSALPLEMRRQVDLNLLAQDLAVFLRQLHTFDHALAAHAGVPVSTYAFGMQEDHWVHGDAADLYRRDLGAYRASAAANDDVLPLLERALEWYLYKLRTDGVPLVLLHNEVSLDHVLLDTANGRVTGVIDFNGMVIGRPARDFLYLYEVFGRTWTERLLVEYGLQEPAAVLGELRFLHVWHTLQRLLWAERNVAADWVLKRQAELEELVTNLSQLE